MTELLKQKVCELQREISLSLESAARGYFEVGLQLYDEQDSFLSPNVQPALGNLAISAELLLKAVISKQVFHCLYPNLSKEKVAILSYPENYKAGTVIKSFELDLKGFTEKSVDFGQACSLVYSLHPDIKKNHKPHLDALAVIRNSSIHGAILNVQKYQVERIAYIACCLFKYFRDSEVYRGMISPQSKKLMGMIIEKFDIERDERVHKAVENAKKESRSLDFLDLSGGAFDGWEARTLKCPICSSPALCNGFTELEVDHESSCASLVFSRTDFDCDGCGLTLKDPSELDLVGIDIADDISQLMNDWECNV